MDKSQLEALKNAVSLEIEETRETIFSLKSVSKPVEPDVAIGRLTRMEAIQSKSINEASLKKAEQRLKALETALRRIDTDPDFGYCEECDEEIPVKRLLIKPEARFCVKCQTRING